MTHPDQDQTELKEDWLTIDLDDELYELLSAAAESLGVSVEEYTNILLEEIIAESRNNVEVTKITSDETSG